MSTVKADNFTWKTGEATTQVGSTVTGPQIVYGTTKSWLNYNAATSTTNRSFNISSITVIGTGQYTANFSNAFYDNYYSNAGGASVLSSASTWMSSMTFGDWVNTYGFRTTTALGFSTAVNGNSKVDCYAATLMVVR